MKEVLSLTTPTSNTGTEEAVTILSNCFIIDDVQTPLQRRTHLSLTRTSCHLCQFPLLRSEAKVNCHCDDYVHEDCYKMDNEACEASLNLV